MRVTSESLITVNDKVDVRMGNEISRQQNTDIADYKDEKIDALKVKCIECVKLVPVFSFNDIEPGDHVVFRHVSYDHHGIIASKNGNGSVEIIEVTNLAKTDSSPILLIPFPPFRVNGREIIGRNIKTFDFKNESIAIVYYRYRIDKKRTVQRADYFARENSCFDYHLLGNNCEHFATYCATGQRFSIQASKVRVSLNILAQKGLSGLGDERERNKTLHEYQLICANCHRINENLLDVDVLQIKVESDIEEGDIIRFSYWGLMHDAVVLQKHGSSKNDVVLTIAHYAFCGFYTHRTIREEKKAFPLNGNCYKVNFKPPRFNVYHPKLVVNRARSRIGEQFFVFFSNDSSHFARWCKLRLRLEIMNC